MKQITDFDLPKEYVKEILQIKSDIAKFHRDGGELSEMIAFIFIGNSNVYVPTPEGINKYEFGNMLRDMVTMCKADAILIVAEGWSIKVPGATPEENFELHKELMMRDGTVRNHPNKVEHFLMTLELPGRVVVGASDIITRSNGKKRTTEMEWSEMKPDDVRETNFGCMLPQNQ
ncbi:hypothetical protein WK78_26510 [Burkholderia cepacia]|uniref:hypothetical protein n=1 Tax=Burkholderia cepacia TaxID=292 RepID=UPI00075F1526|nr:hypothetical protein [Burkholderia cepacia]KVV20865.1 hypothetical protein WK78_26510 [Burkholderia cepacia]